MRSRRVSRSSTRRHGARSAISSTAASSARISKPVCVPRRTPKRLIWIRPKRIRHIFTDEVDRALEHADVLILPTMPSLPITVEAARAGTSVIGMSSLIRPFNLSGHPALTLPVPIVGSSLKAGLQIVGRTGEDETVCAVAAHLEAMLMR